MKHNGIIIALAAAGMLTACSAGDDITGGNNTANDNSNTIDGYDKADLTPISLGISSPISTTTRSTGTVGGTTEETNKWNGQTLWLFMTYKQGQDETKYGKGVMPAVFYDAAGNASTAITLFNNRKMTAPASTVEESVTLANGTGKAITCADGSINYYPMTGTFNFFGYHVDDAATETTANTIGSNTVNVPKVKYRMSATAETTSTAEATIITVPVTIDGSQDLMVGTTTANDPDTYTDATFSDNVKSKFYSAYSARKNVHPILTFQHALSRFTFQVVAGDRTSAGLAEYKDKQKGAEGGYEELKTTPAKVTGIYLNSNTVNELVIADPLNQVTGDFLTTWTTPKDLALKELNEGKTQTLTATKLEWDTTKEGGEEGKAVSVGDALMLEPGKSAYEGYVTVEQWVKTKTAEGAKPDEDDKVADQTYTGTWTKVTHRFPFTVTIPETDDTAKAGTSYNVKIWVYGLTELKVYVTATPEAWKTVTDDIVVNKDED